jgi:hypothetical protein
MKLSAVKAQLDNALAVNFKLPSGGYVPAHFHVTEIGLVTRHFIDCGGVERIEKMVNFQLWDANDLDHRLKPAKLANIIRLSEEKLGIGDLEVEVEYQSDTIGKYGLATDGTDFVLVPTQTACLAQDQCGIPSAKPNIQLATLGAQSQNSCAPGSGCC